MAKKPEQEVDSLALKGSDTCQSQSVVEAEETVDSKQSYACVEITGLSDLVDVQNKELSGSCSIDSSLMSNGVLYVDEDQECMLDNTEGRTQTACHRSDNCLAQLIDSHVSASSEQSGQECVSVAEYSSGNKLLSALENCHFSKHSHISTSSEQTEQLECLSVTEDSQGSRILCAVESCNESDLLDTEAVATSEELVTLEPECNAAVVQVQTAIAEQCLVSDGHLGELLSCTECGSSGLYFFPFYSKYNIR